MSGEIYYTTSGDIRLSAQLHQEIRLLLADRTSFWRHGSLVYLGDAAGSGSTVLDQPLVGLNGYDSMAAVNEDASVSNTALTDATASCTIGRQAIQRQISDINDLVDSVGINVETLAASMVGAAAKRFTSMVFAEFSNFTTTVGATTVNMTLQDYYDATFTLTQSGVSGPWVCALYPVQFTDFLNALRGEAGPKLYQRETADLLDLKEQGYKGTFLGADIYSSDKVASTTGGEDSLGGMYGLGAIGYREGSIRRIRGSEVVLEAGTPVVVEFERNASGAMTKIVGNYYVGTVTLEAGRGVKIITDR